MKNLAIIVGLLAVVFFVTNCSDSSEEATWRSVNKKFIELEKEKSMTFDLLKDKPSKKEK